MESAKTDEELTSTMGNVLSTSKEEKSDSSDTTPTSSTDASTHLKATRSVSDDPISSTSSDTFEQSKINEMKSIIDETDKEMGDLLEMPVSGEKITEDVEDLVHDLETLLEEPTEQFTLPSKRKAISKETVDDIMKDLPGCSKEIGLTITTEKEIKEQEVKEEGTEDDVSSIGSWELVEAEMINIIESNTTECITSSVAPEKCITREADATDTKQLKESEAEVATSSQLDEDTESQNVESPTITSSAKSEIDEEASKNIEDRDLKEVTTTEVEESPKTEVEIEPNKSNDAQKNDEATNKVEDMISELPPQVDDEITTVDDIVMKAVDESLAKVEDVVNEMPTKVSETPAKIENVSEIIDKTPAKIDETPVEIENISTEIIHETPIKIDEAPAKIDEIPLENEGVSTKILEETLSKSDDTVTDETPAKVEDIITETTKETPSIVDETVTNIIDEIPAKFEANSSKLINETCLKIDDISSEIIHETPAKIDEIQLEIEAVSTKIIAETPAKSDDNVTDESPAKVEDIVTETTKETPSIVDEIPDKIEDNSANLIDETPAKVDEIVTKETPAKMDDFEPETIDETPAEVMTKIVDETPAKIDNFEPEIIDETPAEVVTKIVDETPVKIDDFETEQIDETAAKTENSSTKIIDTTPVKTDDVTDETPAKMDDFEPETPAKIENSSPEIIDITPVKTNVTVDEVVAKIIDDTHDFEAETPAKIEENATETVGLVENPVTESIDEIIPAIDETPQVECTSEITVNETPPQSKHDDEKPSELVTSKDIDETVEIKQIPIPESNETVDGPQTEFVPDCINETHSEIKDVVDEAPTSISTETHAAPVDETIEVKKHTTNLKMEFAPLQLSEDDSDDSESVPRLALDPDSPAVLDNQTEENVETVDEEERVYVQPQVQPQIMDVSDNLETMLAVASLQNIEIPIKDTEPVVSEVERREMEALAIAVQSITDSTSAYVQEYEPVNDAIENEPVMQAEAESTVVSESVQEVKEVELPKIDAQSDNVIDDKLKEHSENSQDSINEPTVKEKKSKKHKKDKYEELTINVDVPEKETTYSPKITIKPIKVPDEEVSTTTSADSEVFKGSLKMTITKQSDKMHSILKISDQENAEALPEQDEPIPKLIIKPKMQQVESQHSPKMSTRSSKQSPTGSNSSKTMSPRVTIKPVVKPDKEPVSPLKIKINTKSAAKKEEEKKVVKPSENELVQSPRITIKPIPKPENEKELNPRVTIKPIKKPEDDIELEEKERSSPKITIKPVMKPAENEVSHLNEEEEGVKERIVLKINKGNLPSPMKESKKREHPPDDDKSEKLAKITVKFSKEGGHAHIVHQAGDEATSKRPHEETSVDKNKKQKVDVDVVTTRSSARHKEHMEVNDAPNPGTKHKEHTQESPVETKRSRKDNLNDKSKLLKDENEELLVIESKVDSPIVISEDSRSQDSSNLILEEQKDDSLCLEQDRTPDYKSKSLISGGDSIISSPVTKRGRGRGRGRPRKVPSTLKGVEEFSPQQESTRPKRSCRGQSVCDTLGIKPRKPRGAGRARGSRRGMGNRAVPDMDPLATTTTTVTTTAPVDETPDVTFEAKDLFSRSDVIIIEEESNPKTPKKYSKRKSVEKKIDSEVIEIDSGDSQVSDKDGPKKDFHELDDNDAEVEIFTKNPKIVGKFSNPTPSTSKISSTVPAEIMIVDEETRMSAETNSRAQTPAKQVASTDIVEESQSSATTESCKTPSRPSKAPRLEVQEPESQIITADLLSEYYWNGNGPFMLQEQVAQFLGIKSFKRKYPGIMRRVLDMQERDFIREKGLASENMCDLGLTAVNSADILDIMYSDFQDKYEEYCKHQRDRQAKELINKQKAMTLAASQEKNKADLTEQAVNSAAQWNARFNKERKEQRKACMDLQNLNVHFPKGKKQVQANTFPGFYPVALVPGQFAEYYKKYTPTELNNLPINTLCYDELHFIPRDDSDESGSESESDTSSSSGSSSCSSSDSDSSSGIEDCKLCKHTNRKPTSASNAVALAK